MKILNMLVVALMVMAGKAYAADIPDLQAARAGDIAVLAAAGNTEVPVPAVKVAAWQKGDAPERGKGLIPEFGPLNFYVGDVSIKIHPVNFELGRVYADIRCRVAKTGGDAAVELPLKVRAEGELARVDISGGSLSHFGPFLLAPKSCRYMIDVRSKDGAFGNFTLAGSVLDMTPEALNALLSDTRLNKKISEQNQPLRLMEQNGAIVAVK